MADDVLLNKSASIERCLKRIDEEYSGYEHELRTNYTRQDAIILNILRACEAAIDTAMHIVRIKKLGLPQESREAFTLLNAAGLLDDNLTAQMQAMVGFRNIAVHDYQKLNLDIVEMIVKERLEGFRCLVAVREAPTAVIAIGILLFNGREKLLFRTNCNVPISVNNANG